MMMGLPVVGLVTTDMVTVIRDGVSGFLHTDVNYLITRMKALTDDRTLASRVGAEGKKLAVQRRNLKRFTAEWYDLIQEVIRRKTVMTVA